MPRTEKCGGSVVTTFKRPKIGDKVENLDQDLDCGDPDLVQIDPDSFTQKLLQTIRRNPLVSRKLLAVELNASERKIRDSLKNLKESGSSSAKALITAAFGVSRESSKQRRKHQPITVSIPNSHPPTVGPQQSMPLTVRGAPGAERLSEG